MREVSTIFQEAVSIQALTLLLSVSQHNAVLKGGESMFHLAATISLLTLWVSGLA